MTMGEGGGQDRYERYLRMAREMAAQAQRCGDPEIGESYLQMATIWLKMAEEARPAAEETTPEAREAVQDGGAPDGAAQG
jgi:hypothetical protein